MNKIVDKCRGAIIGGAAGDALGYEVEFTSLREILKRYGERGIRDYSLDHSGIARISDDTQMTLFTAEGLLTAAQNGEATNLTAIDRDIKMAYLAWYATQTEFQLPLPYSWLSNIRSLWARRAPGNTCLSALQHIKEGHEVNNDSKGCGGVMRVAPIGIFYGSHPSEEITDQLVANVASDAAYITHHNDMSTYASALTALIIYRCIREQEEIGKTKLRSIVEECLPIAVGISPQSRISLKFEAIIKEALDLAESSKSDFDAIRSLGEGWIAEETIAIALFSTIRYVDDFENCISCAVNHDGDSDSTGAVAGNIIGAILGNEAIPEKYRKNLELHDVMLTIADDLAGVSDKYQMEKRYSDHKPYGINEDLTIFAHMKFTPDLIEDLGPDDIFVFGSNLAGHHAGGAARVALKKFGAEWGQGVGLQGQSYAIPTMQGGVETIKPYVDEFIEMAKECDQNTFYVTRIGCGIAGFKDEEIAPLFKDALKLYNVRLPKSFVRILLEK